MNRILAAVDFSDASRTALLAALELGRAFGARVRVVHVIPRLLAPYGMEPTWWLERGKLEQELETFVQEQLGDGGQTLPEVERSVVEAVDHAGILQEAAEWGASLIVVGSHGRSAAGRFFLGSVSNQVCRRAAVPVLVVVGPRQPWFTRILAAVELDASAEAVLRAAGRWQKALGAQLEVVHVLDDQPEPVLARLYPRSELIRSLEKTREAARQRVASLIEAVFPPESRPPVVFFHGRPDVEIASEVEGGRYDLVIVGPHQKHELLDLGNTTARLVHRSPCSVLVARGA
jgi:nucleotide-binding universal stress UspA family protein